MKKIGKNKYYFKFKEDIPLEYIEPCWKCREKNIIFLMPRKKELQKFKCIRAACECEVYLSKIVYNCVDGLYDWNLNMAFCKGGRQEMLKAKERMSTIDFFNKKD